MKRILIYFLCFLLCVAIPITAYASDVDNQDNSQSPLSLTVVVPQQNETEKPIPTPEPKPDIPFLYPVSVLETRENGRREITKEYELGEGEKPEYISREPFEREGWRYELTDITKKEITSVNTREHIEPITVGTETNDLEAIIKLLAPTIEYKSEDGYVGVLTLDISTIKVETAGTKTSNYNVNATREYPHLSTNDTSLVPKTITDGGRTLTLSGVTWKTQNAETIDYNQLPESYTAVATYTTTTSKTTVTGYTTNAEYKGMLTKITTGKTLYTAYFLGIQIVTPTLNKTINDNTADTETDNAEETVVEQETYEEEAVPVNQPEEQNETQETESLAETEETTEVESELETEPEQKPFNLLPIIIIILAVIGIGCGFAYFYLQKKKKGGSVTMKKLFSLAIMFVCVLNLSTNAFAYNYSYESGADSSTTFGKSTSTDNPVTVNPETENIRRNKDAAFFPPSYGVFSGDIPTDRTSPYHDNSAPYSGYTGNTSAGAYVTGTVSDIYSTGGSVSPVTGSDYGGMLPSTSIVSVDTVSLTPTYNTDGTIGKLYIPKLDKTLNVYEGETLENMKKGIGHFEITSAWDGNVGFAGHNRGAAAYFSFVKDLAVGDKITYTTQYGTRTYSVYLKEIISDTDYSYLGWTGENVLTLITCREGVPEQRYVVQARELI